MNKKYRILMSIASESDLPPMLMQDKNGICNYLSVNQAVEKARTHSNLSDKFIIDWIYEIVSLDINNRCSDKVIERYCSVPKFHKID